MVKRVMQLSPLIKWTMGIVAVVVSGCILGFTSYLAAGAVKAHANYDTMPKIQKKVDDTSKELQDVKVQTSRDVAVMKEQIARIKEDTEKILKKLDK